MQSVEGSEPSASAVAARWLWTGAASSTLLGVLGQLLFRRFGQSQEQLWPQFDELAMPSGLGWLGAGIACYLVAVLLWVNVLRELPLSRAYPLLGLGYPLVYVGAVAWLGEAITPARSLGTLLVFVGVLLAAAPQKMP